ncbi:MAG: BrnA antitoxin family protein [Truepera sp.]|nr:BrnA antitoxin family protein [Truepera sp.]
MERFIRSNSVESVVAVVHTSRYGRIRLISARKANSGERRASISAKRLIEAIQDQAIIRRSRRPMKASAGRAPAAPAEEGHIRLDTDVIDWLKSKGKGYQTRMNAAGADEE